MNTEEIVRMAREAGVYSAFMGEDEDLERFAALVAAAERAEMAKHCAEITRAAVAKAVDGAIALEREACAKVCDEIAKLPNDLMSDASHIAAAIRARGQS